MKIWVIAFIVSLIFTILMGAIFVFSTMVLLNGFTTMAAAMPTYLICTCVVWPIMVGVTTAVDWGIFALAKQKQSIWHIIRLNAVIVTLLLGALAIVANYV
jgi:hypothetical protein